MMKNFLVVGVQRTGSSALAESLAMHPHVACGWEWTKDVDWRYKIRAGQHALRGDFLSLPERHRAHMTEVFNSSIVWLGFRRLFRASGKWLIHPFFTPALWVDRLEAHLGWLRRRPDIHVLHIVRLNSLEWLKSVYMARLTSSYVGKEYSKSMKVHIPEREAVARLRTKNWVDTRLSTLENSNPYVRVFYEDLLKDRDRTGRTALMFMGCDPALMYVGAQQVQRQSRGAAADYIENHAQLSHALEKTGLVLSPMASKGV